MLHNNDSMVFDVNGTKLRKKGLQDEEIIELRLKPQKTTFTFPNDNIQHIQKNNGSIEQIGSHEGSDDSGQGRLVGFSDSSEEKGDNDDVLNQKKRKPIIRTNEASISKVKPPSVSTINVIEFLRRVKRNDVMQMSGLESMAILSWFVEKMIWLSELVAEGKINDTEVSELLFGDTLWKNIIDNELSGDHDECNRLIIEELKGRKERIHNKRKMEIISKSQEELGVSLRKGSMILSNFENNFEASSFNESDIEEYVHETIGNYEKCCNNAENLEFIHKKFYLKAEPNISLVSYIDRINVNLDISAGVGLCSGWFLFKFLFNLKCDEYLSDGVRYIHPVSSNNRINLSFRSLPLAVGNSFEEQQKFDFNDYDEDRVDDEDTSYASELMKANESVTSIISITDVLDKLPSTKKIPFAKVNKRNAFRLILSSLRIASKLIEDKNFKQAYYCKVTGLQKVEDLFRLELALGYGLDWELFTNEYTLWRYMLHMKGLLLAVEVIESKLNSNV